MEHLVAAISRRRTRIRTLMVAAGLVRADLADLVALPEVDMTRPELIQKTVVVVPLDSTQPAVVHVVLAVQVTSATETENMAKATLATVLPTALDPPADVAYQADLTAKRKLPSRRDAKRKRSNISCDVMPCDLLALLVRKYENSFDLLD